MKNLTTVLVSLVTVSDSDRVETLCSSASAVEVSRYCCCTATGVLGTAPYGSHEQRPDGGGGQALAQQAAAPDAVWTA